MEMIREAMYIIILVCIFLTCTHITGQTDSNAVSSHFSGKILATNNGISLVPSFSLDKPALLFNLSLGKRRLSFDPDIRFSLEGKPWSMLFWFRYKAVQKNKLDLRVGMHPGYNFRTIPVVSYEKTKDVIETRRFLAFEIAPNYRISDKIKVGAYYLFSLGFDDSQKYTHFVTLNTSFPNIKVLPGIQLGLFPSFYYLRLDDLDGVYFTSGFELSKSDFPLSLEAIINQKIRTDILPERRFVWNVSLVYSFHRKYIDMPSTF